MSSTIGLGEAKDSNQNLANRIDNDYFNSDLTLNAIASAFVGTLGYASSWISPKAAIESLKRFDRDYQSNEEIKNSDMINIPIFTAGYLFGTYHNIERILDNPANWTGYIPVATNLACGGAIWISELAKIKREKKSKNFSVGQTINF